ncbi:MAG: tryptophan--tRNA ligase [Candidatus Eisenbacteria bacterium]|uniref:Tryptophan--tRNA ligase n=1 Tax=Eiseniibacteriota bacterium TaxID=2212470 RepID=A0A538SVK0_UNCEI|nr:MAG: tryptophan--tRNA ligase [Candidatus Eisenbacteria bacterium]
MRPTGRLHLGNYLGALQNWVELQGTCENLHMVADWHALTTDYEHVDQIQPNTVEMVTDWLAAGIDPEKSPVFIQSRIKEHAELHLLFSMLVTTSRLERNPTVKEQVRDLHLEDTVSYGHLGYPVLQAADILLYKANLVPVGEDQVPHIELTREIARKFNSLYGEVFPVPAVKLTQFPRVPGLDGRRMSKSLDNAIYLSDSPEEIAAKARTAYTDPKKIRANDPGNPDGCVVFAYHRAFNAANAPQIDADCRAGRLGCVANKKNLAAILAEQLRPFRERRRELEAHPERIREALKMGEERARKIAQETMKEVREAMKLP